MNLFKGLVLLSLTVVLALLVWSSSTEAPFRSPVSPPSRDTSAPSSLEVPDAPDRDLAGGQHSHRTARDYLAEYWGERWALIEPIMLENGMDLGQVYEPVAWEDVADRFEPLFRMSDEWREAHRENRVKWPLELTSDWLVREFPMAGRGDRFISPRELAEIELLCSDVNAEIYENFEVFSSGIDQALHQSWIRGDFTRAPFSTHGVTPIRDDRAFYASAASFGGWAVSVQLYGKDYPEVVDADRAMARLRDRREALVVEYLKSL